MLIISVAGECCYAEGLAGLVRSELSVATSRILPVPVLVSSPVKQTSEIQCTAQMTHLLPHHHIVMLAMQVKLLTCCVKQCKEAIKDAERDKAQECTPKR